MLSLYILHATQMGGSAPLSGRLHNTGAGNTPVTFLKYFCVNSSLSHSIHQIPINFLKIKITQHDQPVPCFFQSQTSLTTCVIPPFCVLYPSSVLPSFPRWLLVLLLQSPSSLLSPSKPHILQNFSLAHTPSS